MQSPSIDPWQPEEYPFDLGVRTRLDQLSLLDFTCPESFANPRSSKEHLLFWLRNGLVWCYAFNHEESIKCFERALQVEPSSAMAHWGISVSHGPNYNTPMMTHDAFPSAEKAYEHAMKAQELAAAASSSHLSEVERALIEALQPRFNPQSAPPADPTEAVAANTAAYATALEAVYRRFPDVACVAALYAESLMQFSPWKMWDLDTGSPNEHAVQVQSIVQRALQRSPMHPGLNHFHIHLMEMSPTPEAALPSCKALYGRGGEEEDCAGCSARAPICPDAGHLVHMPSHIFVLLGMWNHAVDSNTAANVADRHYVATTRASIDYYTGYRIHNLHFIAYAACFSCQFEVAMKAAMEIKDNLTLDVVSHRVLSMYYESFFSIDVHVLIRFGKWAELEAYSYPEAAVAHAYPYTTAMITYGKGIAYSIQGNLQAAVEALERLEEDDAPKVPASFVMHNNKCSDLVLIALYMLKGEIEYRCAVAAGLYEGAHHYQDAFRALREAVRRSDALVYDEPWGWMQPPRHALGALLCEYANTCLKLCGEDAATCAAHPENPLSAAVAEAAVELRRDMDRSFYGRCHPDNIWALVGLQHCLEWDRAAGKDVGEELRAIAIKIERWKELLAASDARYGITAESTSAIVESCSVAACMCATGTP